MLRGVNKQIVEVNQTNSPYFEKIYFVIKPGCSQNDYDRLGEEATRLVEEIDFTKENKSPKKRIYFYSFCGLLLGIAGTLLVFKIF